MNKSEALDKLARYEALSRDFGYANADSLREAKSIVWSLRTGGLQDAYFREKLASLDHWATIGFSVRKFAKYPGGAEQVRVFALGDASTARDLVEQHWQSQVSMAKDSPSLRAGEWIRVGVHDCVVTRVYPEGSSSGAAEVVFNRSKPTTHDVAWDGKSWFFPERPDFGGYGRQSDPYVQQLLRGKYA